MFTYCGNNPINRSDPSGDLWAAVLGGGIAGALISAASYLIANKGNIDGGKLALAVGAGFVSGALGAYAGVKEAATLACSIGVGVVAACVTAINTDGGWGTKVVAGLTAGAIAGVSTYQCAKFFPILSNSELVFGVTGFAGGLMGGALTESFSVAAQELVEPMGRAVDSAFSASAKRAASTKSSTRYTPNYLM